MKHHTGEQPRAVTAGQAGGVAVWLGLVAMLGGLAATPALAEDAEGEKGFWQRDTLTGDWGGARSGLEEKGVTVSATYTGEVVGNTQGGRAQSALYSGLLQVDVEADLEKLAGWKGGLFHVSGLQTHGRGISSTNLGGNWIPSRDIETAPSTRLFALWLQQSFLDDMVSIRAGQVPMQEEFFNSTYAANLIGSPFGWPGAFAFNMPSGGGGYPLASPGARVKVTPTDNLSLLAAVFSGDPAPGADGRDGDAARRNATGTDFSLDQPPVWFGEAQYSYNQDKDAAGLPGTVKLGGWYYNGGFNDLRYDDNGVALADTTNSTGTGKRYRGNWALYGIIDQQVWHRPGSEDGGLGVFFRATMLPDDRNQMPYYFDTGLALKGTFEGRDDDVFAIGFAYGAASSRLSDYDADQRAYGTNTAPDHDYEAMLEVSYRYAVTPWWTLVPDAQYIFHPGANAVDDSNNPQVLDDAVILGLRTVFTL